VNDEFYIAWEDLKNVFLKQKNTIGRLVLYGIVLSFCYFLQKPCQYMALATFKQAMSSTQEGFDFRNLLRNFSAKTAEGSAAPLMLSRTVLGATAEELGLQLKVTSPGKRLRAIWRNLQAEWGKKLKDEEEFEFRSVKFSEEEAQTFYLQFTTPTTFILLSDKKQMVCKGKVKEPICSSSLQLTLTKIPSSLVIGKLYSLTALPLEEVVAKLRAHTVVKPVKEERSILTISFKETNRQRASLVVNTLMAKYEAYLTTQNQAIIRAQLSYLEKRQDELGSKWDKEIEDHTAALKTNLSSQGFLTSEEGIGSILEPLQEMRKRVHDIDVEMASIAKKNKAYKGSLLLGQFRENILANQNLEKLDQVDFSAVSLTSCRNLYQTYSQELDKIHAELKSVVYFRDHLHEPHFEMSTLCNVLSDSVTQQLVSKSIALESQLCDATNYSSREQERIKEMLSTQKRFLSNHLSQTLELGHIRTSLLQEKLSSLQSLMHHLLAQEKSVIEHKMKDLTLRFHDVPQLWQLDKKLKFRAELTKGVMEGLAQITESKTLAQHLYQVESKPIDSALTPIDPLPPYLFVKAALVGLALLVLSYLFFLIRALVKGLPASLATLRLMGATTAGPISQKETLQRIAYFLLELKPKTVAVLSSQDLDWVHHLELPSMTFVLKQAPLNSPQALHLLSEVDAAIIVTSEEPASLLYPYLEWSRQKEKICATFAQYA
jgi:hypothetical protein